MIGDHFLCLGKIKKKKGWLEGKSSWPLGWKAYSGSEKVMICLCIALEHRLFILLSVSVAAFIQKNNIQALNIVCVPASVTGMKRWWWVREKWPLSSMSVEFCGQYWPRGILLDLLPYGFSFRWQGTDRPGDQERLWAARFVLDDLSSPPGYGWLDQRWTPDSDWTNSVFPLLATWKWDSEVASCHGLDCVSPQFICWSLNLQWGRYLEVGPLGDN